MKILNREQFLAMPAYTLYYKCENPDTMNWEGLAVKFETSTEFGIKRHVANPSTDSYLERLGIDPSADDGKPCFGDYIAMDLNEIEIWDDSKHPFISHRCRDALWQSDGLDRYAVFEEHELFLLRDLVANAISALPSADEETAPDETIGEDQ